MSKRKVNIKFPKERAVLSDAHPFETPIMFSNRYYHKLLVNNKLEYNGHSITEDTELEGAEKVGLDCILKILFGADLNNPNDRTIPFSYRIKHKESSFRELALIHPLNQLVLVNFYDRYKNLILYYCSKSNYSIRRPHSIAKFTFFNDKLHQSLKGTKDDFLEIDGKEYESLKTFFTYKQYPNIYRFYEDYVFHRSEKKFKQLLTFDISKCFDSIYTHSITWAVLGLKSVKENVWDSKQTFSGKFDKFIQYTNYGETNGIVIGPEFSRIFAEIILQEIDSITEKKLEQKGIIHKDNYALFRYVDDYFLFFDDETVKDEVINQISHLMKSFKLGFNDHKTKPYAKPIITEITIAKDKITRLLDQNLRISFENTQSDVPDEERLPLQSNTLKITANSKQLITDYKTIIVESNVDYKDVLNYSLAILNRKIEKALVSIEKLYLDELSSFLTEELDHKKLKTKLELQNRVVRYIEHFLDFTFFIYSVAPRVNSTIKICHILSRVLKFTGHLVKIRDPQGNDQQKRILGLGAIDRIHKKIYDESTFILSKNAPNSYSKLESLYLLSVLVDLGKNYRLNEDLLSKYLGLKPNDSETQKIELGLLNYFSIVVLLYYMRNSTKYSTLRPQVQSYIAEYIKNTPLERRQKSSEIVHLVSDLLFCPYVDSSFKWRILCIFRGASSMQEFRDASIDISAIKDFVSVQKYMFTKWKNVDLSKEFDNKKSMEVYS